MWHGGWFVRLFWSTEHRRDTCQEATLAIRRDHFFGASARALIATVSQLHKPTGACLPCAQILTFCSRTCCDCAKESLCNCNYGPRRLEVGGTASCSTSPRADAPCIGSWFSLTTACNATTSCLHLRRESVLDCEKPTATDNWSRRPVRRAF